MAQHAADTQSLLTGLHDIRLPLEPAGAVLTEVTAAVGLGLLLALCLAPAVRALTRPKPEAVASDLGSRMAALDGLDEESRRRALIRLVAELRPESLRAMEPGIYRPGGIPSSDALEAALRGQRP